MRGVASIADLEQQLVALLNSFCVPPLAAYLGAAPWDPARTSPLSSYPTGPATQPARDYAAGNPDEIALPDDDDGDGDCGGSANDSAASASDQPPIDSALPTHFNDFGLGPIAGHPLVMSFFRPQQGNFPWPPPRLCSSSQVLQLLLQFVKERGGRLRDRASAQFVAGLGIDFDAFECYAAQSLEVPDLRMAGGLSPPRRACA